MSSNAKDLMDRGRFLRNAAPREFEAFCTAFDDFMDGAAYDMVQTDDHYELLRAQGRVQQCLKLQRILGEIKNG